jgi:hypothetical protein
MSERNQVISYLTSLKRDLTAKHDELLKPVEAVKRDLDAVSSALAVILRENKKEPTTNFPIATLRGLTYTQCVATIASHYGGKLKAQDAKRIMIEARIMPDSKNATHMVHNAILQSGKFDRIGRGEFRLKNPPSTSSGGSVSILAAHMIDAATKLVS